MVLTMDMQKTLYKKSLTDWIIFSLINNKKINVFNDIFFSPLTFDTLSKIIEEIFNIFPYIIVSD